MNISVPNTSVTTSTALSNAYACRRAAIGLLVSLAVVTVGIAILTKIEDKPPESYAAAAGLFVATAAFGLALCTIFLIVFQMEQVEGPRPAELALTEEIEALGAEHRESNLALTEAIKELAKEIHDLELKAGTARGDSRTKP